MRRKHFARLLGLAAVTAAAVAIATARTGIHAAGQQPDGADVGRVDGQQHLDRRSHSGDQPGERLLAVRRRLRQPTTTSSP